jgi:hypothetical protein
MIESVGPGFGSGLLVAVNPGCADVLTSARMGPLYTTCPIPKNYFDMLEPRWSARLRQARSVWFIWSLWYIWFIRLVWFNQLNETDQTDRTDQMNKTGWRTFSAAC